MSPSWTHDPSSGPQLADTICGIATPLGQGGGGIGIIRISGPSTFPLVSKVFHGKHSVSTCRSHTILHGFFIDPTTGERIDEILLSVFRHPHSYTGEDIGELSFHGSPTILRRALAVLTALGIRQARPGEFTFRAFYNGRIDLTQAEAVVELVNAKSEKASTAAFKQLEGSLKTLIGELRAQLIECLAWLEMSTDFSDEDLDLKKVEEITTGIDAILAQLTSLEGSYQRSRIVRDGLKVTIVGAPNVGKSSIFNRLLARDRSIVTAVPGTTRDTVEDFAIIDGYAICFVDTAGIRKTADAVETIGIDRSIIQLAASDLVLWVVDGSLGFTTEDREIRRLIGDRSVAVLINKSDVAVKIKLDECLANVNMADHFVVSAETGDGIDNLLKWLVENRLSFASDRTEFRFLINQRHLDAIAGAKEHLQAARRTITDGESPEFSAFEVRFAIDLLGEIIGKTTRDDILNKIFADFCIGK